MDVRAYIEGTECNLRPICAKDYIEAEHIAREKTSEMGADGDGARLVFGAELISRGAYDGENRVFSDGDEVLSRLTAQEIVWLASEYFAEKANGGAGAPTASESVMEDYARNTAREESFGGAREKMRVPESAPVSVRENVSAEDFAPIRDYREVSEKLESVSKRRKRAADGGKADGARNALSFAQRKTRTSENRADMRAVSDFFERDCRRYDGAFRRF